MRRWIVERLSGELEIDPADIRTDEPLIDVGLDPMDFVGLVVDLENWLGCRFKDSPLIDYPTADALAEYLAGQLARGRTTIDPTVSRSGDRLLATWGILARRRTTLDASPGTTISAAL